MDAQDKEGLVVSLFSQKPVEDWITEHKKLIGMASWNEEKLWLLVGEIRRYSDSVEEQRELYLKKLKILGRMKTNLVFIYKTAGV